MAEAPHRYWSLRSRVLHFFVFRAALLTVCGCLLSSSAALAVIDADTTGNTTPPTGAGNDPGFYNVGTMAGGSIVYLGNRWAISAAHVYTLGSPPTFRVNGVSTSFPIMNGLIPSSFGGADLRLINLNADPGLPALTIATSSPTVNQQVMMIGNGRTQSSAIYFPNVVVDSNGLSLGTGQDVTTVPAPTNPLPPVDSSSVSYGNYQVAGQDFTNSTQTMRWGTNLVTKVPAGLVNGTSTFYTTFNNPQYSSGQGTQTNEAQASNGDSGGGVFTGSSGNWKLSGIMMAVNTYNGNGNGSTQPNWALYGESTYIADLSKYNTAIQDVITPLYWTGQNSGAWNSATINWERSLSTMAYHDVTSATFGDTNPIGGSAITNNQITIQASGVSPASVTFNNSAVNYFVSNAGGAVGITGSTGLAKNGTGSLTFQSANSFSGPTMINVGRIALQNASGLGTTSSITIASGATLELQGNLALGAIPLSTAGTLTGSVGNNSYAGAITPTGPATFGSTAAGTTLSLSGNISTGWGTYSESLNFTGSGAVNVGGSLAAWVSPMNITLNGGPVSFNGGITIAQTINSTPGLLTFAGTGNATVSSPMSGTGGLVMSSTGTLTLSSTNSYSGGTTINAGSLIVASSGTLGATTAPLVINANGVTTVVQLNSSQTIGGLSGSVSNGGSAQLNIASGVTLTDNQSTTATFGGGLVDSGSFIKNGAGNLTISGSSTFNSGSALTVNQGTLTLNSAAGPSWVGSGVAVTVASGATLQLAGTTSQLSSGANYAAVNNSTSTSGLTVVSGAQNVGVITGPGVTTVGAGAGATSLTANSMNQGSLVIGANAVFQIRASGAAGSLSQSSPLATAGSGGGSLSSAASLTSESGLLALLRQRMALSQPGSSSSASLASLIVTPAATTTPVAGSTPPSSAGGDSISMPSGLRVVPEPAGLALLAIGCGAFAACRALRPKFSCNRS